MTLKQFQALNKSRAAKWHNGTQWTLLEWAGAMCGEAGEAANIAKKLRRLEQSLPNKQNGIDTADAYKLYDGLAKECADTIMYAICIMNELGLDASTYLNIVFNTKSEEYGFIERSALE